MLIFEDRQRHSVVEDLLLQDGDDDDDEDYEPDEEDDEYDLEIGGDLNNPYPPAAAMEQFPFIGAPEHPDGEENYDEADFHDYQPVIQGVAGEPQLEEINDEGGHIEEEEELALGEMDHQAEPIEIADPVEQYDVHPDQHEVDVPIDPVADPDLAPDLTRTMNERYGVRTSQYNLRPRRPPSYGFNYAQVSDTTQYNLKAGLKKFGKAGEAAVLSELEQLHKTKSISPKDPSNMTEVERKKALRYLMFLKQKRCGKVKGRGCADGSTQRPFVPKEDASSPTVAIESVLLTSVIDAMERRYVATVDIPGAFLHADMDRYNNETVHMKLEGEMAELMVRLDPKLYRKYVTYEGKRKVLYVELLHALYGTLRSALLFWQRLSSQLQKWGFKLNPYDWCVANKTINGKQCTITWHIDDLKISHVDKSVVMDIIALLSDEFGKNAPLTVTEGPIHDYLGMKLDFSTDGAVKVDMTDYVKNILDNAPDDVTGVCTNPAPTDLFTVDNSAAHLDENAAEYFHHMVAKMLFLCKRGRPDIQPSVAFLTTRVKEPNVGDYLKLCRVLRYLRGTQDMVLTLRCSNIAVAPWYVDASYATHPDMRSHTGGTFVMDQGAVFSQSTRQKLTTKSSTEAELVGVSDILPQILWTRYFLEAQGCDLQQSVIYQDNQSAILLEKHGKGLASQKS